MPLGISYNLKKCIRCGKPLLWGDKFCSRECKSLSQIKRILLVCCGCGKSFLVHPYRKRPTNYCSIKCYWDSTRTEEVRSCRICGKKFVATGAQIRHGFGIYCSRKCQHKIYPKKLRKICILCKKYFLVWPSHAWHTKFCSKKCRDDSMRDYVSRTCRKCGKSFDLPRSDLNRGRGNFCTYRCFLKYRGPSTLEEKMEKALNLAGIKFEREIKFKRFHVDFLIRNLKSVIECDGEHWHLRPVNQERDRRKDELLKSLGYKVYRFSGKTMDKYSENKLSNLITGILN